MDDHEPSGRPTVLSAFLTALNGSMLASIPAFFCYAVADDLRKCTNLIGYYVKKHIHSNPKVGIRSRQATRYEYYYNDKINTKHPYYFFDGIQKLFERKACLVYGQMGTSALIDLWADYYVSTTVCYTFKSSELLSRFSISYEPPSIYGTEFRRCLLALNGNNFHYSPLSSLSIDIRYKDYKQSSIVDNANYTIFKPSKVLPTMWQLSAKYEAKKSNSNGVTETSTNSTNESHISFTANSIRHLLGALIVSRYCAADDLTVKYAAEYKMNPATFHVNLAELISVLSDSSRRLVSQIVDIDTKRITSNSQYSLNSVDSLNSGVKNRAFSAAGAPPEDIPVSGRKEKNRILEFIFEASPKISCFHVNFGESNGEGNSRSNSNDGSRSNSVENNKEQDNSIAEIRKKLSTDINSILHNFADPQIGYFLPLMSVLAGQMPGGICEIASLWVSAMDRIQRDWESGSLLNTFKINSNMINKDITGLDSDLMLRKSHSCDHSEFCSLSKGLKATTSGAFSPGQPRALPYSVSFCHKGQADVTVPICRKYLWEDVIESRGNKGIELVLPNLHQHLIIQKLQMLQFCVAVKSESTVWPGVPSDNGYGKTPSLLRRVPLTTDVLEFNKKYIQKLSDSSSNSDDPNLRWKIAMPHLQYDMMAYKYENGGNTMEDFCEWYGLNKFANADVDTDKSEDDLEELNSNSNDMDDMPLIGSTPPISVIAQMWALSPPMSSSAQKPLFKCEKEVEKALSYLTKLPLSQLLSLLLIQSMTFAYYTVAAQIHKINGNNINVNNVDQIASEENNGHDHNHSHQHHHDQIHGHSRRHSRRHSHGHPQKIGVASKITNGQYFQDLLQDLSLLKEQIDKCTEVLENDIYAFPTTSAAPKRDSDTTTNIGETEDNSSAATDMLEKDKVLYLLIDSIAGLIEKLELECIKLDNLEQLVNIDNRKELHTILEKLARKDRCNLSTEGDVHTISSLIRTISNNTEHAWNSYDGRELGYPKRKVFQIRKKYDDEHVPSSLSLVAPVRSGDDDSTNYDSNCDESKSPEQNIKLLNHSNRVFAGDESDRNNQSFEMSAYVVSNSIRLCYSIPDN